ncbi:TPA: hypothetical protein ACH3X2_006980 [Trebouxia sp. C0005]
MRRNSGNNLSRMGNGSAHMGPGSVEDLQARLGSSRQNVISIHSIGRESPDDAAPLLDGGLQLSLSMASCCKHIVVSEFESDCEQHQSRKSNNFNDSDIELDLQSGVDIEQ